MDRVKVFYSGIDIKPKILINHFFRYLGLYIEDITNKSCGSDRDSLIDIYIVSDAYVDENSTTLDIKKEKKTILIYLDGWYSDKLKAVRSIQYGELKAFDFLKQLSDHMLSIFAEHNALKGRLTGNVENLEAFLDSFIKIYVDSEILQVTLFARCFPAQRDFCAIAQRKYFDFIYGLRDIQVLDPDSDLIKYIYIRAQYELDFINKVNSYTLYSKPQVLDGQCTELLKKYADNETLHILKADINFVLNDSWNRAGYEYSDIRLADCAYAYFRQGQILHRYLRDRDKALEVYKVALQKKKDYYGVWFQIGDCHERQGKYADAIEAYENVRGNLKAKYQRHILAPLEIYYLFCATMRIAEIYALRFRNYRMANKYIGLSDNIQEETGRDGYFRLVWGDENPEAYGAYFPLIQEEMVAQIESYKKHLVYGGKVSYEYEWEKNQDI